MMVMAYESSFNRMKTLNSLHISSMLLPNHETKLVLVKRSNFNQHVVYVFANNNSISNHTHVLMESKLNKFIVSLLEKKNAISTMLSAKSKFVSKISHLKSIL